MSAYNNIQAEVCTLTFWCTWKWLYIHRGEEAEHVNETALLLVVTACVQFKVCCLLTLVIYSAGNFAF